METKNSNEIFEDKNILLYSEDNVILTSEINEVARKTFILINEPKSNPYQQLQEWRKLGKKWLEYGRQMTKLNNDWSKLFERMENESMDNHYKRWTKEEDEILIGLVCDKDMSVIEMSVTLGRTPQSITNRITQLVGIKRISQEVAGKFIGKVNGEEVSGNISGILYK